MLRVSVIRGDDRNVRLRELLEDAGFESELFDSEQARDAAQWGNVIVLPLKGIDQTAFNGLLKEGQTLVTGEDFLTRQDFAILNAIATVEGALQVAMENTAHTIHGGECLVIGYGRIGKLLANKLAALDANVTVSARKAEDFAWIESHRFKALNTMSMQGHLEHFDIIFNTVPHLTLSYSHLLELKKKCLVVDLASQPGGVDFKAAEKLNIPVRWALSLPGKVAPESAAKYMMKILLKILQERGVA